MPIAGWLDAAVLVLLLAWFGWELAGSPPVHFNYRLREGATKRIIIHASHTGPDVGDTTGNLRIRGREHGLLDIGYHFVIERDGRWTNTRWPDAMGSHAPGLNHNSVGICLANDGTEYPSKDQVESLKEIIGYLFTRFGPLMIQGHTEAQRIRNREPCPGFDLGKLREDLKLNDYTASVSHPGRKEDGGKDNRQLYENMGGAATLSEQQRLLLEYLSRPKTPALTNLIALTNLGIGSLSSRISELRRMGHNIVSEDKLDFNGRRYVSYTLQPKAP